MRGHPVPPLLLRIVAQTMAQRRAAGAGASPSAASAKSLADDSAVSAARARAKLSDERNLRIALAVLSVIGVALAVRAATGYDVLLACLGIRVDTANQAIGWGNFLVTQLTPLLGRTRLQFVSMELTSTTLSTVHHALHGSLAYTLTQTTVLYRCVVAIVEELFFDGRRIWAYKISYVLLAYFAGGFALKALRSGEWSDFVDVFPGCSMLITTFGVSLPLRLARVAKLFAKPFALYFHYQKGTASSFSNSVWSGVSNLIGFLRYEFLERHDEQPAEAKKK
eukprot:m.102672 g.102672  ORF g.102672 m.102672 type:complete len:280 (+) comp15522_c0_seq1:358-1197(+)